MYSSCRRWGNRRRASIVYLSKLYSYSAQRLQATRLWVWLYSDTGNKYSHPYVNKAASLCSFGHILCNFSQLD